MDKVYFAARWDKGTADYINCPFTKEEYNAFIDALTTAEVVQAKEWEQIPTEHPEKLNYFEGCLPIEETARRGRDTLRFGPMKPAGLTNPKTGRWPYAAVQLRCENLRADSYNLVGFQNHLKFGEQARILRMIPGLEDAKFLRYGQIHRNTYIHAPSLLTETLQLRARPDLLIAGQLSGVEGYTESIASGMLAGIYAAPASSRPARPPPPPASPPTAPSPTTSPTPTPKNSNPPTSPSTSSPHSKKTSASKSATKKSATASSATAPFCRGKNGSTQETNAATAKPEHPLNQLRDPSDLWLFYLILRNAERTC